MSAEGWTVSVYLSNYTKLLDNVMLLFLNNFVNTNPDILYDNVLNKSYLLILKNGTTSMQSMVANYPNRYSLRGMEFLNTHNVVDITIFIRPPFERAISALMEQMRCHGITSDQMGSIVNNNDNIPVIDPHIIPQFWFLLSLTAGHRDLKMNFLPISELHQVDVTIPILNSQSVRDHT